MRSMPSLLAALLSTGSLTAQIAPDTPPATFVFRSLDAPGEGFNDDTPTSALEARIVGDNPGQTVGELRENVLVAAGERWSRFLRSSVPIVVDVDFEDLGGSDGASITLAGAGAVSQTQNFANAPLRNTLYPIALANSLAGSDLSTRSDISVTANSNDDLSNSSQGPFTWYYGLDSNAPFGTVDFLSVIAHELGHGLGFAANVSSASGGFFGGRPNAFSSFIFDTELGLPWTELTSAQRFTSSRNDPNLTWNGPAVTNAVDGVQSFVNNGLNSAQSNVFAATQASFGGSFPLSGITGNLVLVDDGVGVENNNGEGTTADLVQPLINGNEVSGSIALISRGISSFNDKALQAEAAGAIAVVIYNNVGGDARITASSVSDNLSTLPITFVSENSGQTLIDLIEEGDPEVVVFGNRVEAAQPEGAPAPVNRLRLFGPSNFDPGSSISHWSRASSPNLLMEPSISRTVRADLDLTPLLMKDIGWRVEGVSIPHLTYETYLADLGRSPDDPNLAPEDDFDADGISNLAEYFFGTNLERGDAAPFRLEGDELVHQRAILPNDLLLEYQTSSNLTDGFTRITVDESVTGLDFLLREARAPVNMEGERAFFRLLIQEGP